MLACQSLVGGVHLIGWTYRLMQRVVLRQWWVRSEQRKAGVSFTDFLAADAATRTHLHWPNWYLEQNFRTAVRRTPDAGKSRCGLVFTALFHSLWINLKTGFQGICNTWLLTLPTGLLWVFAWYDGWNNSFNKGYEQYYVGMIIGGIGVLLFIAAMFYVPLAQARQAVTGDWRAFYSSNSSGASCAGAGSRASVSLAFTRSSRCQR